MILVFLGRKIKYLGVFRYRTTITKSCMSGLKLSWTILPFLGIQKGKTLKTIGPPIVHGQLPNSFFYLNGHARILCYVARTAVWAEDAVSFVIHMNETKIKMKNTSKSKRPHMRGGFACAALSYMQIFQTQFHIQIRKRKRAKRFAGRNQRHAQPRFLMEHSRTELSSFIWMRQEQIMQGVAEVH